MQSSDDTASHFGAWHMPEEYRALRDTLRRFVAEEVRPLEEALPHDSFKCPPELLASLQARAKALGLWCYRTPEEHGGAGLNLLGQAIVGEEVAQCRMGAYIPAIGALGSDPPNVIWEGNQDQIARYGLPAVKTGKKAFVAISEPTSGSDPGRSIQLSARREGDKYILNGSKMWITAAGTAEWGIVYARTGGWGRSGITSFIIDMNSPGVTTKEIPVIRSYSPYEIHFDNVEMPIENRLGEEGEGFKLAEKWLVDQRISYSAAHWVWHARRLTWRSPG